MNTVHNERVKLTATLLNNLAAATMIGGYVTTVLKGEAILSLHAFAYSLVWIAVGIGWHLVARYTLGLLRE